MLTRLASTAIAAGIVTTLVAATPLDASKGARPSKPAGTPAWATEPEEPVRVLQPRTPYRKRSSASIVLPEDPVTGVKHWNGRLVVKFRDDLKVRAEAMPGRPVRSRSASASSKVNEVAQQLDATVRPYYAKPVAKIRELEVRAERKSGKAQPDFAGTVFVDVLPERLLEAARAFNDLPEVEWVYFDRDPLPCGQENLATQFGCGTNGPGDATGINNCYTASASGLGTPPRCSTLGGGGGCNNVGGCEAEDGATQACRYGCNDEPCCDLVSGFEPSCSQQDNPRGWDALCASYANLLCFATVYDGSGNVNPGPGSPTIGVATTTPIPGEYKYDPCGALRAPPTAAGTQIRIQGSAVTIRPPDAGNTFASQLLTVTLNADLSIDPLTLKRISYNNVNQEADPASGVAQQAILDPSLEGALTALAGSCFNAEGQRGCNIVGCCVAVCRTDSSCCSIEWDQGCVQIALNLADIPGSPCTGGGDDAEFPTCPACPTPLFTGGLNSNGRARGLQLYTIGAPIVGPDEVLPTGINSPPVVAKYTVNNSTSPTVASRDALNSNLGTMMALNSQFRGGGLDMLDYEDLLNDLNLDADTQGRGQGIRVAVVDRSAYVNHEDLVNRPIRTSPSQTVPDNVPVVAEPGQTQTLVIAGPLDPNHGTAVLGVIGAGDNEFGVTGVAFGSELYFYPAVSREEGQRFQNATLGALIDLREGDILCIPMDLPGPAGYTVLTSEPIFDLISTATDAGITVIVPAGNEASPITTNPPDIQENLDSGAIVVGACWPGYQTGILRTNASNSATPWPPQPAGDYCRWRFSSFSDVETAGTGNLNPVGKVWVSGWGTGVFTTGYGLPGSIDFQGGWNGENEPVDTDPINGPLERDNLRGYSGVTAFQGTSAAAAMITGWAACVQSFSLQWFGLTLPPRTLRAEISRAVNLQCARLYTNGNAGYPDPPGPPAIFGDTCTVDGNECVLAPIGGFPITRDTIGNIMAETIGGNAPTITIVTGVDQGGNNGFSLTAIDGSAVNIGAVRRRAGNTGQGYGPPLFYPLTGGTTDMQLSRTERVPPASISTMNLRSVSRVSTALPVVQLVYFYNFDQQRWVIAGSQVLSSAYPAAPVAYDPAVFGPLGNFLIAGPGNTSTIYARIYTCGLGQGGYSVLHDLALFFPEIDIFNP